MSKAMLFNTKKRRGVLPQRATAVKAKPTWQTFTVTMDPNGPATLAQALTEARKTGVLRVPLMAMHGPRGGGRVELA